jgi:SAM-dependent methyltransferase
VNEVSRRPFYAEYAWAFDLLIDRPVRKECAVIAAWLIDRRILPGSEILDAGSGTGRYAIELAGRGYIVQGMDLSPDLIEVAKRAVGDSTGGVSFTVADIARPSTSRYAGIVCRGVLNDIADDAGRDAVFAAFSEALQPNGVLILDVRDWGASLERKTREPLFRKRVSTDQGELTFTSVTILDPENRQLLISERHQLIGQGGERASDFRFVMRCWERAELDMLLERHGFGSVLCFGAYDPGMAVGVTDRLVVVAERLGSAARQTLAAAPRGAVRRAAQRESSDGQNTVKLEGDGQSAECGRLSMATNLSVSARSLSRGVAALIAATALVVMPPRAARTFDLSTASITDINAAFDAGALTSEGLTRLYLSRIAAYDKAGPRLNSVLHLNPRAIEDARARRRAPRDGQEDSASRRTRVAQGEHRRGGLAGDSRVLRPARFAG